MNVNDELQILRKKVVMNQFNVLYKNDSGRAEINTKYFNQASPYPGQDYHQQPPISKAECYPPTISGNVHSFPVQLGKYLDAAF
jgi:hypothetical protein